LQPTPEDSVDPVITSSALKARIFVGDDIEEKNHFQSAVYAHLGHTDLDAYELERNSSKKFLQYYPQTHQFTALNARSSPPIPTKPPFSLASSLFPSQQIYNGPHISNLHEGNWKGTKNEVM
jgi:hypothetical protein